MAAATGRRVGAADYAQGCARTSAGSTARHDANAFEMGRIQSFGTAERSPTRAARSGDRGGWRRDAQAGAAAHVVSVWTPSTPHRANVQQAW
jgi:hypothetical protein